MRSQPLICVRDVEASSLWYQRLLGCQSGHGPSNSGTWEYERLVSNGQLVLQLHKWDVGHHHGPIGDPNINPGNGVLLWFEVDDLDAAVAQAGQLKAETVMPKYHHTGANQWECWLRDQDGYIVVLSIPEDVYRH